MADLMQAERARAATVPTRHRQAEHFIADPRTVADLVRRR